MLAMGIDADAYTPQYTRSFFSDEAIADYMKEAIDYVHAHGGAVCATHPNVDYWRGYDYDAIDKEPMRPLSGTDIERNWLDGNRLALMNSVDFYGPRRILDNPAVNFLYLKGEEPCRESVVRAIRRGNTIAACGFEEADITIGDYVPGDEVPLDVAQKGVLSVSARISRGGIRKLRVYSGEKVIYSTEGTEDTLTLRLPLAGLPLETFIRVELEGQNEHWICNSTPFYLN